MKKGNNKIIIVTTLILLLLLFPLQVSATATEKQFSIDQNMQSLYQAMRFREAYTTIVFTKTAQEAIIEYPDNYAGMYIDQNDLLHVCYVNNKSNLLSDRVDDTVIFESDKFSYSKLEQVYQILSDNLLSLRLDKVFIDEVNNKVDISTASENQSEIIAFLFYN